MGKKRLIIMSTLIFVVVVAVAAINLSPKWSEKTFEAVVKEKIIQPDGEVRFIVQRITEVYANPLNSLHIDENTVLVGVDGKIVSVENFQEGDIVSVTLKDSFVEEVPFYYPMVYEVKVIGTDVAK